MWIEFFWQRITGYDDPKPFQSWSSVYNRIQPSKVINNTNNFRQIATTHFNRINELTNYNSQMKCEITITNDKQSTITLAMNKKPSIPECYKKKRYLKCQCIRSLCARCWSVTVTMEVLCFGSAAENRLLLVIACEDHLLWSRKKIWKADEELMIYFDCANAIITYETLTSSLRIYCTRIWYIQINFIRIRSHK